MRNLNECKAEIFRLSEKRIADRRNRARRAASLGVTLCLFLILFSATAMPGMLSREGAHVTGEQMAESVTKDTQAGTETDGKTNVYSDATDSVSPPDTATPEYPQGNNGTAGSKGPILGGSVNLPGLNPGDTVTQFPTDLPYGTLHTFEFSLTWNTYGISSYNSKDGKLVKTTDAANPDAYVTTYHLTDGEKQKIYDLIKELDITSYPDIYDPHNGTLGSDPSMTLILSVKTDKINKTVTARNIALTYKADNEAGQRFLNVCAEISDILTATDRWKALPEYELYYY